MVVGSAVSFNTNGPIIGSALTHVVGTTSLIINTIGTYVADFTLRAVQANQFSLMLNGVPIPGGRYGTGINRIQTTGTGTIALSNNERGDLTAVSAGLSIF
ncbi:hypothetical protein F3I01_29075 [Bacillus sp. SRB1LM]|nr:hypothetical protein [Bacillus sp. SRB1LM]